MSIIKMIDNRVNSSYAFTWHNWPRWIFLVILPNVVVTTKLVNNILYAAQEWLHDCHHQIKSMYTTFDGKAVYVVYHLFKGELVTVDVICDTIAPSWRRIWTRVGWWFTSTYYVGHGEYFDTAFSLMRRVRVGKGEEGTQG